MSVSDGKHTEGTADAPRDDPRALSRRFVLQAGGTGALLLGFELSGAAGAATGAKAFAPNAYIRIAPDDMVTLVMPSVEMGQGTYTSVPMILAEELDIPLTRVQLEAAPPDQKYYGNPIYGIQMTGGSTTIRGWWMPLRKAGASARAMLVGAAAAMWRVDPASCRTADGTVFHDPTKRSATYGSLAAHAALIPPPVNPKLKDPKTFKLVGRSLKRLDTPAKVNGTAVYGIDAMPPGVKFATLASSPVFGGRVAHVDDRAARAVQGVRQIIVLDDLVAVVGDHTWAAKLGLEALVVEWDGAHGNLSQADIWRGLGEAAGREGVVAQKTGDAIGQLRSGTVIEGDYELPFLAHAAMEPMNCTVHLRKDACEIWVGTQAMGKAQAIAVKESGLRAEQIVIHNHLIGGGFGRRLEVDGIGKAVRIARHVDGPVKVVWSREEDIQQEMYRPVYHDRMSAKLEGGRITAWRHRVVGPAILARYLPPAFVKGVDLDGVDGAVDQPYDFPHLQVEFTRHELAPVPTSFWRGVGPNSNIFSAECFIDKLARQHGIDPLVLRQRMLAKNRRALAALDHAAAKAEWTTLPRAVPGGGRFGRGIAMLSAFGSYLAAVADVAVTDDGEVRLKRIVCAVDCGTIVNPDGVLAQVQGGMIFGLSAILHGQITIEKGRVQQGNFNDYRVLRIDEIPKIEVYLMPSEEAPGGIGEPGTVVVQPAVANAVYAATGKQLTRMPIDPKEIAITRSP
ncbi:MAG: molybdopterin cofactor-binding domain-containing protein [Rhizomicrobium sp.]